jgi:hypothetical protein
VIYKNRQIIFSLNILLMIEICSSHRKMIERFLFV